MKIVSIRVLVSLTAIKTNTSILVSIDGKDVELTAADLIKMREKEVNALHN